MPRALADEGHSSPYIWFMNGSTITSSQTPGQPHHRLGHPGRRGLRWERPGRILWRNSTSEQVYIWLMNRATITSNQSPGTPAAVWQIPTFQNLITPT